jgi:hypothetical protein
MKLEIIWSPAGEVDPEQLAQDAALGQIQRELCDVALSACKGGLESRSALLLGRRSTYST